jgi:predicted SAM-dependent methyltransferase
MKLNLGSGPEKGINGWINIDLGGGADLAVDLTKGIPFEDCSVSDIYTSHFLEHLSYDQIKSLLTECLRVLKPGGMLLTCVPNSEAFIRAYADKQYQQATLSNGEQIEIPSFLVESGERVYSKALVNTGSKIDWMNYIAYSANEHKYMFDKENLRNHLIIAGFVEVNERPFDHSLDKSYGRKASLYFSALKPDC